MENFELMESFNHGSPVSKFLNIHLQTTFDNDHGLIIGDDRKKSFNNNVDENPFVGLIEYKKLPKNFFLRASFSCREMDDTSKFTAIKNLTTQIKIHAEENENINYRVAGFIGHSVSKSFIGKKNSVVGIDSKIIIALN